MTHPITLVTIPEETYNRLVGTIDSIHEYLMKGSHQQNPQKKWVTKKEAKEHAGVSMVTLDHWIRNGWVEISRPSPDRVLVNLESIDRYYDSKKPNR